MDKRIFQIALTLVPGIGSITGKKLIRACGSSEAVFSETASNLVRIRGLNHQVVRELKSSVHIRRAEKELGFIARNRIQMISIEDEEYPFRLRECEDGPLVLFFRGNGDLNARKTISVVGTRSPTEYGQQQCVQFIRGLKASNPLVISGLAYGIDSIAHRTALQEGLDTLGVMAHGFHTIYPPANRTLASRIVHQGGLLTEFVNGAKPDRENFPKRNRIVAGLSDAVLVVESAERGGALITADIALSYNRDVFAIPGRVNDIQSGGCNWLIYDNKAALVRTPQEIISCMQWGGKNSPGVQSTMFTDLDERYRKIYLLLREKGGLRIDQLLAISGYSNGELKGILLEMELSGYLRVFPGNLYMAV